jgi:hypothetical protein
MREKLQKPKQLAIGITSRSRIGIVAWTEYYGAVWPSEGRHDV